MFTTYLIIAVVVCFIFYTKWRHSYWKRKGVYQIKGDYSSKERFRNAAGRQSLAEISYKNYMEIKANGQKHAGNYFYLKPIYTPIDPDLLKHILQKDFAYFMDHGTYHHPNDILSMHLFNLEGETWKDLRMKLTPTFTSGKMKMMFETLVAKTEGLEKVVKQLLEQGETLAIKDVLSRFTTDIIGSCAFGIECNSLEDPETLFRKFGKKVFMSKPIRFIISSVAPRWLLGNIGFRVNGYDVTNFFIQIVKNTIKTRERKGIIRKDFMHLLLQLKNAEKPSGSTTKKVLTEDEIIAQCFVFFIAGFETSSSTMTSALLELAQNKGIQNRLREEINETLERHNGEITYDSVKEMTYLNKVINETLRKFPPVPIIPRVCSKNYILPGTNIEIEKGTRTLIPVFGLHRDPEYYPNPEEFNPENFSEENIAKRPDFTFLPFGDGPRQCIGLRFGVLQSKVGLISLIRNFHFTLNSRTKYPVEFEPGTVILSVKGDVWLDATKV